jgi:uncharacterized protein (TIGR02588 family)
MSSRAQAAHRRAEARKAHTTPALEWLLGALGAVLLFAAVALLIRDGLNSTGLPGAIEARVVDVTRAGAAFVVRFELHNAGDETLGNLRVTARLSEGDKVIESVSTLVDYLPAHSKQFGGFYLRHDPAAYTLEIAPEGYQAP